jgi:hypothetical protein
MIGLVTIPIHDFRCMILDDKIENKGKKLLCFKNYSDHRYSLPLPTLAMFVLFSVLSSIHFILSLQFDQVVCNQCRNIAYAQNNSEYKNSFSNNITQQWVDKNNNVKILLHIPQQSP